MVSASHIWGLDLGGTKIEGAILDPASPGKPLCRRRLPTEADQGYEHVLDQIALLCRTIAEEAGLPLPEKIGMGTPGVIDPKTGRIKGSNTQCLNGRKLGDDISAKIGRTFVLANDANCFALAEAHFGAGHGYPTVFGIILGTGVGGGLVVHGRVLEGCHGIAGEWGQLVLEPGGPVSNYGTRGTVEAFISGPALERFYAEQSGGKRSLREIAARAESGEDAHAQATIERLTGRFAQALGIVVDVFDPHAIIIGGGVGNVDALYTPVVHEKITARIFNPTFDAALLRPTLGDSAGVIGAAMLVVE